MARWLGFVGGTKRTEKDVVAMTGINLANSKSTKVEIVGGSLIPLMGIFSSSITCLALELGRMLM